MERVNQYRLYELAVELRQLPDYSVQLEQIDTIVRLYRARQALAPYLGDNPPMRLVLAQSAAKELLEAIDELNEIVSPPNNPFREGHSSPSIYRMRSALERFEVVLSAECESSPAFVAAKRGIYDTEELVNAAGNAIPAPLRQMMPSKAIDDLGSAGRCLAFGLFTAAGFHMCRAVEAMLEEYYHRFTGKSGTLRGWHDYIGALDKAIEAGHNPAAERQTLTYLNQLRDSSRNPIMHPRVVLEEPDAFMIFHLGCGAISKMALELQAANKPLRKRKSRMLAI